MRVLKMAAAVLAVAVVTQTQIPTQVAAQSKAPIYRYCLQEQAGFRGTTIVLCRFNTLQQCWQSRNGPMDFCYRNPAYRGR